MEKYNSEAKLPQQNLIQILLFRYLPYWPIFSVIFLFFLACGYCYLKITPPKFKTTASVLIKDEKKGVDNQSMMGSLNIYASKKIVENEIEVIKSKSLLLKTVEQLNLSARIFNDELFFDETLYSASPINVEFKDVTKIKESSKLPFFYDKLSSQVNFLNQDYSVNEWIDSPYGILRFVKNPHAENVNNGLFYLSIVDPRRIVEILDNSIDVTPLNKLSSVVVLSILDTDTKRAENILNTLIKFYIQSSIDEKNTLAFNTMQFVDERIGFVERQLDSIEVRLQQYKSNRGIVDLSEQGKLYLQNVGENDRRLSEINMQLAVLDKVEKYVIEKNDMIGIVPATFGISDPSLTQLVEKLYESELKYERLSKTTPSNNLIMVSLRKEIEQLRPSILENVQNQRINLQAGHRNVNKTNNIYTTVLQSIPKKERELLEINRQQLIKNNVYTFLLQKREETALSYASIEGDSKVIDKANSLLKQESPKEFIVYSGSFVISLFLCIGYVSLKEIFSNKILFRKFIEDNTAIPIVGEISHTYLKEYLVVGNEKKKFLSEQFRQLRASMGLYGKATQKVMMVTSSIPGEGKSFIAANFATSLALSNKKVLLIDFDLRNPRLTNYFKLEQCVGVSDYLSGKEEVSNTIRECNVPNLYMIGAGTSLVNVTELILNGDLFAFFDQLKVLFDFIIVDTAPIDPVTDAFVLDQFCDKTLFVMRHSKTPKSMVNLIDSGYKNFVLKNVSIVFNGVKIRGFLRNQYGYGFGSANNYISTYHKDRT